jgi:hypothetical protein
MASIPQFMQKKLSKKMEDEEASKKTLGPSARESEAAQGRGTTEDIIQANARKEAGKATATQGLQDREANKGSYSGLGLADRAAAERMVRNGEAKDRDEAAASIKKRRQPKASAATQAGALEK